MKLACSWCLGRQTYKFYFTLNNDPMMHAYLPYRQSFWLATENNSSCTQLWAPPSISIIVTTLHSYSLTIFIYLDEASFDSSYMPIVKLSGQKISSEMHTHLMLLGLEGVRARITTSNYLNGLGGARNMSHKVKSYTSGFHFSSTFKMINS